MAINTLRKGYSLYLLTIFVAMLTSCDGSSWESLDLIIEKNLTCDEHQKKFALAVQNFTYCSILSARPISFCESCIHSYLDVLTSHDDILEGREDGVNCKAVLINMDRLEIIETFFTNVEQLWNKGNCNFCFQVYPNGTITSTPNNNTSTFQEIDSSVRQCIKQNMYNKSTICSVCGGSYEKLNDFYNSLKNSEDSERVCMDIVDSMNASRMEWSRDLGCRYHSKTDLSLILSASFVSIIPIIFYVLVKKYSSKIESRLLHRISNAKLEPVGVTLLYGAMTSRITTIAIIKAYFAPLTVDNERHTIDFNEQL